MGIQNRCRVRLWERWRDVEGVRLGVRDEEGISVLNGTTNEERMGSRHPGMPFLKAGSRHGRVLTHTKV